MAENASVETPLVDIRHLKEYFPINTGWFKTTPLKAVEQAETLEGGEE